MDHRCKRAAHRSCGDRAGLGRSAAVTTAQQELEVRPPSQWAPPMGVWTGLPLLWSELPKIHDGHC